MYKYNKLVEQLLEDFSTLPPNSRILSRTALCKKYRISRTTADRAMSILRKKRVIDTKVGNGSFLTAEFSQQSHLSDNIIHTWGVIMPNIMLNPFPGILRGIEDVAQENGINTIICNTDYSAEREQQYITRLIASNVAGVIIVPSLYPRINIKGFHMLLKNRIPCVFCNRGVDELGTVPYVSCNNFYGGYIAAKHLLDRGYRKLGFLSAIRFQTSIDRLNGFCAALNEAQIPIDFDNLVPQTTDSNESDVSPTLRTLLKKKDRPDAIFCHNDIIARQVYDVATELGLRISDDIGVIGFDNSIEIALSATPQLTSISFEEYAIGHKAAELLLSMIQKGISDKPDICLFQPRLIQRDSCLGPKS